MKTIKVTLNMRLDSIDKLEKIAKTLDRPSKTNAVVYCASGCYSYKYNKLCEELKN